jgi:sialate O-acetylesterase
MRNLVALCLLVITCALRAEVTLPSVFSDHMVLQADMAAPIFGTAGANEQIAVEINDQKKTATAGADGKWQVKLDPMKAGGPFELKVGNKTIKDVLVGEVWLASGQSNMRFPFNKVTDAQAEIAKADFPKIRYLLVPGKWVVCSPKTCANFSGVAYFFAADLHSHLKVPVGIVENAVSGACAQQFTSKEVFDADPELSNLVSQHKGIERSDIFNSSFVPIIPYGIRGAIWYQGEGNRDFPITYRKLLPAMIADWRKRWGEGDFPFIVCQLANWQAQKPDPWEGKDCALRESQLKISQSIPNAGLVVTIDLGIEKDVHYPNKRPAGERFATAARGIAYGEKIEYSGPIFDTVKLDGAKAVVSFKHVGGGLVAKGGDKLQGFLLCGDDKKWVRAEAAIEGETVVVKSDKVPAPKFVRYAWERNPVCNLYNKEGLPASPFRSDDFVNYFTKDGAD